MKRFIKNVFKIFRRRKREDSFDELMKGVEGKIDDFEPFVDDQKQLDDLISQLTTMDFEFRIKFEFNWHGWQIEEIYPSEPNIEDHIQVKARLKSGVRVANIPEIPDFNIIVTNIEGDIYIFSIIKKRINS